MGPKKKVNRTDLTLRNLHALKKALKKLEDRIELLEDVLNEYVVKGLYETMKLRVLKLRSNKGK